MKNKIFFSMIAFILFSSFSINTAYSENDKSGTSSLIFLKFGSDAKAVSMGEAFTAQWQKSGSAFWNPAAISGIAGTSVNLTHTQWFQDVTADHFSAFAKTGDNAWGLSLSLGKVPGIEKRDEIPTTEPLAQIDAHDVVLSFSYARSIKSKYSLGLSAKWIYEKIDVYSASGFGFDMGCIISPFAGSGNPTTENLRFGAAILDLGSKIKFKEDKFPLPTQYKAGVGYSLEKKEWQSNLTVNVDVVKPRDDDAKLHLGTEYELYQILNLRLGYQFGYSEKNISFGMGIKYKKYAIDYAFVPYKSDLGDVHCITLKAEF
ncbi:MAG TPA: PorV/PorQ family protein [candidate division Zixibacteria bacterium]